MSSSCSSYFFCINDLKFVCGHIIDPIYELLHKLFKTNQSSRKQFLKELPFMKVFCKQNVILFENIVGVDVGSDLQDGPLKLFLIQGGIFLVVQIVQIQPP